VAEALGLGSPGAARRLYSAAVRPHTQSVLVKRVVAKVDPVDVSNATLEQLRKKLAGRTIIVDRKGRTSLAYRLGPSSPVSPNERVS